MEIIILLTSCFFTGNKTDFFRFCEKTFQEVHEGMYILLAFTPESGKLKV